MSVNQENSNSYLQFTKRQKIYHNVTPTAPRKLIFKTKENKVSSRHITVKRCFDEFL